MLALQYGDLNHVTLSCKKPVVDRYTLHRRRMRMCLDGRIKEMIIGGCRSIKVVGHYAL